ncbi:unnamed protein product [Owenia fusiformis]|uniref:Uncharacterized protein n=1 Tax=Owenia fusiformis TaxID=6347 RepID=A0A8S4N547_OWEFU|nr:unnamed protein product [Owenia fusiformis]
MVGKLSIGSAILTLYLIVAGIDGSCNKTINKHIIGHEDWSTCTFYRVDHCIVCRGPAFERELAKNIWCDTIPTEDGFEENIKGPIPLGYYALGNPPDDINADFYAIYPQRDDGNGFLDYKILNPETSRKHLLLGSSKNSPLAVKIRSCWKQLQRQLNLGRMIQKLVTVLKMDENEANDQERFTDAMIKGLMIVGN